jgi:hypothetical protein
VVKLAHLVALVFDDVRPAVGRIAFSATTTSFWRSQPKPESGPQPKPESQCPDVSTGFVWRTAQHACAAQLDGF